MKAEDPINDSPPWLAFLSRNQMPTITRYYFNQSNDPGSNGDKWLLRGKRDVYWSPTDPVISLRAMQAKNMHLIFIQIFLYTWNVCYYGGFIS